ncbi:DoxX family protein [Candidatus Nitrosotenuis uzonensis]|uniref:DoxX family protein n=1 Tax=Candidatus Nitrosotenuis uzonensis TaxID=1407055 RepID=V6ATE1_9ARCH|nr:DoxX family protein [Candidatus Nitrosotenuis uzonensis]
MTTLETTTIYKENRLHDLAYLGIRLALGAIFIVHGYAKVDAGFAGFLGRLGLPAEMQILIALAEIVPGVLLIAGVITRISASILSTIMLGAIFYVKKPTELTGQAGFELELILLVSSLLLVAVGAGKFSASHTLKKLPGFLK